MARAAAPDVAATEFIAQSRASREALKSATLLKDIGVNAVITGAEGTGRRTLALQIVHGPVIEADRPLDQIEKLVHEHEILVLTNFEKMRDIDRFARLLEAHPTRIIATSHATLSSRIIDRFFSITIHLPPLSERPEDVEALSELFVQEARRSLGLVGTSSMLPHTFRPDLSHNAYSLKRSIYLALIAETIKEGELMDLLEDFLQPKLENAQGYRELLYLYEVPLLKAAHTLYTSQLQMAERLGLNRNTLRKKINELKEYL